MKNNDACASCYRRNKCDKKGSKHCMIRILIMEAQAWAEERKEARRREKEKD